MSEQTGQVAALFLERRVRALEHARARRLAAEREAEWERIREARAQEVREAEERWAATPWWFKALAFFGLARLRAEKHGKEYA